MQDEKSLMLCWCSLLGGSIIIITTICAHKGGQYHTYGLMSLSSPVIIQDARPKIDNAALTLIAQMGQPACHFAFFLQSRPILPLWEDVTMELFDCRQGKTKSRWRSVVAHLNDILTVIGCSTILQKVQIVIMDSQYIVSMYNYLHSKASRPLCFWAMTTQDIWTITDVGSTRYSAFGRQLMAYWPIH